MEIHRGWGRASHRIHSLIQVNKGQHLPGVRHYENKHKPQSSRSVIYMGTQTQWSRAMLKAYTHYYESIGKYLPVDYREGFLKMATERS